jgi:hypothetical protein
MRCMRVRVELAEDSSALPHLGRCMAQFADFCVVTENVRRGIPVSVEVVDAAGRRCSGARRRPSPESSRPAGRPR